MSRVNSVPTIAFGRFFSYLHALTMTLFSKNGHNRSHYVDTVTSFDFP